jgi:hypothetical protein
MRLKVIWILQVIDKLVTNREGALATLSHDPVPPFRGKALTRDGEVRDTVIL